MSEASDKQNKVAYVQSQSQTRDHTCHWPGCGKQTPPAMWGCKTHWFRLPKKLRDMIWLAYRPGQEQDRRVSERYRMVARLVQEWILSNANSTKVEPK